MSTLILVVIAISCGVYVASHISWFQGNQIRQGVLFGLLAIMANTFSSDFGDLKISVGLIDAPPMIAGFFFGPVAGILSGAIAAIERTLTPLWGVGAATWGRCSTATFLVSVYAVLLSKMILEGQKPNVITAFVAAALGEILHLALIFIVGWDTPSLTCEITYAAFLPMTLGSGAAAGIASLICAWRGWRYSFFSKTTRSFLLFGFAFGIIAGVAIFTANRSTTQLLNCGMADFNKQINDHIGFMLHRSARSILQEIGTFRPIPIDAMQKIADAYNLDEVSLINADGTIIASNGIENLQYKNFVRSNHVAKDFFELLDGDEKVVKQSFRKNLAVPSQQAYFVGVSFPGKSGILQLGYTESRLLDEFEQFFIPQMRDTALFFNGYFLIVDSQGKICCPVYKHPEALEKTLRGIGFTDGELEYAQNVPFNTRLFGDWSRCIWGRQLGKWRIYAVLPLRDLYDQMLKVIFVAGLSLFGLCLLFRWTILRMISAQKKVEELNAQKEELNKREMLLAYNIQMSELKEDFPDTKFCRIKATMHPAKDVGGDFYDPFILPDGKVVIGIADVSGKGVPAAIFMMKAKTTLKLYFYRCSTVKEVLETVNNELCRNNEAQMFVTCWTGIFDPETGDLEYVNAGHNPPLIVRANGSVEWVNCKKSLALAAWEDQIYPQQKIHLEHGDRIFLYTDGVTEAMNQSQELYGNQRLFDVLNRVNKDSLVDAVLDDVKLFTNGAEQSDDITMLEMQIK